MKINPFCFLVLLLGVLSNAQSQETRKEFVINGSINADTGLVELLSLSDSSYYPQTIYNSAQVKDGKFTLKGNTPYPIGVSISYNKSFGSGMFLVQPGHQSLQLDLNDFGRPRW